MTVLLVGVTLLASSFATQLVLFRVRLPRRQTPALLAVYASVPLLVIGVALGTNHGLQLPAPEAVRLGLFYVSFALAYIVLHSAIEMQSPTLAIVSYVAKTGATGCSDEELFARFGRGVQLSERLALMESGGLIQDSGDVIDLTAQGRSLAMLFERAGRIFGLAMGG